MFKKNRLLSQVVGAKIDNILGPNTNYNGTIKSDGNIRIDGVFQGHVETAGNVIIGPSASVLADIVANAVQVWGAVRGNIVTKGRVEILPDGRVWGDIRVGSLTIDEGGVLRGQCIMGGETLEPLMLPESVMEEMPQAEVIAQASQDMEMGKAEEDLAEADIPQGAAREEEPEEATMAEPLSRDEKMEEMPEEAVMAEAPQAVAMAEEPESAETAEASRVVEREEEPEAATMAELLQAVAIEEPEEVVTEEAPQALEMEEAGEIEPQQRPLPGAEEEKAEMEPEPAQPVTSGSAYALESVCQSADENGIGRPFRRILETMQQLGLHPRPYKHQITYSTPQSKGRLLFSVSVKPDKDGRLHGKFSPQRFIEDVGVPPSIAARVLGPGGEFAVTSARVSRFTRKLEKLVAEAQEQGLFPKQ